MNLLKPYERPDSDLSRFLDAFLLCDSLVDGDSEELIYDDWEV